MRRRQAEQIAELRAVIADQQDQLDELTRTVAAWRLIARALLRRPPAETR